MMLAKLKLIDCGMKSTHRFGVLFISQLLFISVCFAQGQAGNAVAASDYKTIEWPDLMPKEDLDALMEPPEYLDDIEDGSEEDQIASQVQMAMGQAASSRYQAALNSTRVIQAFDGRAIRLPGFIVPLEFGNDHKVTRFFLVPYFGACIHVPPPPPNQIIYAEYDKGIELTSLYDPYWLSGVLRTSLVENDTATAAYTIKVDQLTPYTD